MQLAHLHDHNTRLHNSPQLSFSAEHTLTYTQMEGRETTDCVREKETERTEWTEGDIEIERTG